MLVLAFHIYRWLEYNAPSAFLSLTAPLHKYTCLKRITAKVMSQHTVL